VAQQYKTVPAEKNNGLFGRFSARPTPDFYNQGCSGGPRSLTVRRQAESSEKNSGREITAHLLMMDEKVY